MGLLISSLILINFILFLWMLLIASNKFKSEEEKILEDNLQMQYLKEFARKRKLSFNNDNCR